jgi:hypothetical protein
LCSVAAGKDRLFHQAGTLPEPLSAFFLKGKRFFLSFPIETGFAF